MTPPPGNAPEHPPRPPAVMASESRALGRLAALVRGERDALAEGRLSASGAILAEMEDVLESLRRHNFIAGEGPRPSVSSQDVAAPPNPAAGALPTPEERLALQALVLRQENLDLAGLLSRLTEAVYGEHLVLQRLAGAGGYDGRGRSSPSGSSFGLSLRG